MTVEPLADDFDPTEELMSDDNKAERDAVVWQLEQCEDVDTDYQFRKCVESVLDEADDVFGIPEAAGWTFLAGIGIKVCAHPTRDAVAWRKDGKWIVTSKATLEYLGTLEVAYRTSDAYDEEIAAGQMEYNNE